jgi:hypothetical protein
VLPIGRSGYVGVEIQIPQSWYLHVRSDGGGIVGYGSGASDAHDFPPGTFDFEKLVDELKPKLPGKAGANGPFVGFDQPNSNTTQLQPFGDTPTLIPLFEKALDASSDVSDNAKALWKKIPPRT